MVTNVSKCSDSKAVYVLRTGAHCGGREDPSSVAKGVWSIVGRTACRIIAGVAVVQASWAVEWEPGGKQLTMNVLACLLLEVQIEGRGTGEQGSKRRTLPALDMPYFINIQQRGILHGTRYITSKRRT